MRDEKKHVQYNIGYVINAVGRFIENLSGCSGIENLFQGKVILEFGAGDDLATGLYMIAMGTKNNVTFEENNLASYALIAAKG
ncbi:MAG: hypothetical protein ISR96_08245 [Nitrospira sp.]|nr:hypothetical protein [Nitrospira sp.]